MKCLNSLRDYDLKMSGHLFILSGASGSGKSTLLNSIMDRYPNDYVRAIKYSTRKSRGEDDDIEHTANITEIDQNVPYAMNDDYYAINTNVILQQLNAGKNALIIISDLRVVRKLKSILGDKCSAIYISSFIDATDLAKVNAERHDNLLDQSKIDEINRMLNQLKSAQRLEDWSLISSMINDLNKIFKLTT